MAKTQPSISVMIVNDNQDVCELWKRIINTTEDMHCAGFALDGQEAVEKAREMRPDVIMMDVMMPRMHGYDATRIILEERPETLVIVYSAFTGTRDEAFRAGAVEYLLMPIDPDQLRDTIRRVVLERAQKSDA